MRIEPIRINGVQEALAELNKIDPRYRRQVTKKIKKAGDVIVNEARSLVSHFDNSKGNGAPLSNMTRSTLIRGREIRWQTDAVQAGFKTKVGVRPTRERYVNFKRSLGSIEWTEQVPFGALPYRLMVIQQADAAGAIYDHAGRHTYSTFVANLEKEVGPEPRAIDKAVNANQEGVQKEVMAVIEEVERITNRNLKRR